MHNMKDVLIVAMNDAYATYTGAMMYVIGTNMIWRGEY